MSVYIKGMEMPTNCGGCKLRMAVGCCGNLPHNTRMPNCPLIPVPEHGRLIDAGKIGLTDFEIILCQKGNTFKNALEMLLEKIENAPTIIPAEEVV